MDTLIQKFKDAIADSSVVELMIINRDMEVVWFNDAMAAWLGDLSKYAGRKCHEAFDGESQPHDNCRVIRVFETGEPQHAVQVVNNERRVCVAIPLDEHNVGEVTIRMPKGEQES